MVLAVLTGGLDRQERQAIAYLMEENRVLRRQLGQQRIQFSDADRRRLAVRGYRLGRQILIPPAVLRKNDRRQGFPANIGRKHSTLICSSPIAEDRPGLLVTVATLGPGAGRARILPGRASTRTAGP